MYTSRISLPDFSKLDINRKNDSTIAICRHDVIVMSYRHRLSFAQYLETGAS